MNLNAITGYLAVKVAGCWHTVPQHLNSGTQWYLPYQHFFIRFADEAEEV